MSTLSRILYCSGGRSVVVPVRSVVVHARSARSVVVPPVQPFSNVFDTMCFCLKTNVLIFLFQDSKLEKKKSNTNKSNFFIPTQRILYKATFARCRINFHFDYRYEN